MSHTKGIIINFLQQGGGCAVRFKCNAGIAQMVFYKIAILITRTGFFYHAFFKMYVRNGFCVIVFENACIQVATELPEAGTFIFLCFAPVAS